MSEQPQVPQPSPATSLRVMSGEIVRLNENRMYLIALLEDTQAAAAAKIAELAAQIDALTPKEVEHAKE